MGSSSFCSRGWITVTEKETSKWGFTGCRFFIHATSKVYVMIIVKIINCVFVIYFKIHYKT